MGIAVTKYYNQVPIAVQNAGNGEIPEESKFLVTDKQGNQKFEKEAVEENGTPKFISRVFTEEELRTQWAAEVERNQSKKQNLVQDSAEIIYYQMKNAGETNKTVIHNGVQMNFECIRQNGGYRYHTTIGTENKNTKWYSISTKNGTVTFDLNNPGNITKCLDMLTPEEVDKIMQAIQIEKAAQAAAREVESFVNKTLLQIQDSVAENTEASDDLEKEETMKGEEKGILTDEQLKQLLTDDSNQQIIEE